MKPKTTRPTYLEVSGHFLNDAVDFEIRYNYCINSDGPLFYTPRSRRLKTFIDLRMGLESALKSLVTYHEHNDRQGKTLINWIEKYGHNIEKLITKAQPHIPEDIYSTYQKNIRELSSLPVGLRYQLDALDFHENKEELYHRTLGSDVWLKHTHEGLVKLIALINSKPNKRNRVVTVKEVLKEMSEPRHKKYT